MNDRILRHHPGFLPFEIKDKRLANRFVVAPMSRVSATADGLPTKLMQIYYSVFAKGGFSMVITEGLYTASPYSQAYPHQPGLVNDGQVEGWMKITESVKKEGAVFIAQLMHAGALSQNLTTTLAPSAVLPLGKKMPEYGGGEGNFPIPEAMSKKDIVEAVEGYIQSAVNAYKAGFDGIEIHAANGYLPDQFLTPYTNFRKDEYGGSVKNRYRIIEEILQGIRTTLPSSFIIGLRLSEGKVNNLFYRWPEGADMAKAILNEMISGTKPDYIHIAAESGNWQRDCTYADGSSYPGLARQMLGLPTIANGGLHRLEESQKVIDDQHADLVAIGSAALADPQWPVKISKGIEPVSFQRKFIKPSATIEHTNAMRE